MRLPVSESAESGAWLLKATILPNHLIGRIGEGSPRGESGIDRQLIQSVPVVTNSLAMHADEHSRAAGIRCGKSIESRLGSEHMTDGLTGMVITIDGPAGAGKSTVARELARRLGFEFLDTGAMYRAVAWACLQRQIDLTDSSRVVKVAASLLLDATEHAIHCNGEDVTLAIRSREVSHSASIVAAIPGVRIEMVRLQRLSADGRNIVTEGRDQGSVVFPDAECKFFVTASAERRAERRQQELSERGQRPILEDVLAEIIARDERDRTRDIAPLVEPENAITVDSSDMPAAAVIDRLEGIALDRLRL